jgi:transposase
MRGKDEQQLDVFSYVSPEQRVPQDHPLRPLRVMTDEALRELQPRFHKLYAKTGRPSIAPEKLLRALLLQALYSVRSERLLMERLDYNLLFRWFVGLNMDDAIWDVTVFTKNRAAAGWGHCRSLLPSRAPAGTSGVCSRTSTSPWMERYWKRGRV